MRKPLLTLILIVTIVSLSVGQDLPIDSVTRKVTFSRVINLDTAYSNAVIYSLVKEWFLVSDKTFNRSNSDRNGSTGDALLGIQRGNSNQIDQLHKNDQPLKLQDPAANKILGKSVLKYTGGSMGCLRIMYLSSDVIIKTKDNKLKIEISNLNYIHYNQISMKQVQIYGWNDNGTCNSKNSIEELLKCDKCKGELNKFYSYLTDDMNQLIDELKVYLNNNKPKKDDW